MLDRSHLLTELPLPASEAIDTLSTADAVALLHAQDLVAVQAVGTQQPQIVAAVDLIAERMGRGGRLFYFGAGTSGRLGVLDASEIPPTFRADPMLVQGIIAGGTEAMFRAQEGAEDDAADAARRVNARGVTPVDIVIGIAAGGTTPFPIGAVTEARRLGAGTIFISCVQPTPVDPTVDVYIRPLTGPEVITGSTRMKAGTATKLVLNALSTLAMVRLGKVYGNRMVDLRASNIKLRDRATRLIAELTGLPRPQAETLLDAADGHVKTAVVMHHRHVDQAAATSILEATKGRLRPAINP